MTIWEIVACVVAGAALVGVGFWVGLARGIFVGLAASRMALERTTDQRLVSIEDSKKEV